jgi:hypothetical protein
LTTNAAIAIRRADVGFIGCPTPPLKVRFTKPGIEPSGVAIIFEPQSWREEGATKVSGIAAER